MNLLDYPLLMFGATLLLMVFAVWVGAVVLKRIKALRVDFKDDFGVVLGATLTLMALLIGFTFSMATFRYDLRKNLEEEEANAIGTEFLRAGLLPAAEAEKTRGLLREYYEQRVLFYTLRDQEQRKQMDARTVQLQTEMWSVVNTVAATNQSPTIALAVAGMNDVINSQGYAQAAAWNRIPTAAWLLMLTIAVCCHLLIGYGARDARAERLLLVILPFITAISFLLISDIDSPLHGVIRVRPDNLTSISESLR